MATGSRTEKTSQRILNEGQDSSYKTLITTPYVETTVGSTIGRVTGTVTGAQTAMDVNLVSGGDLQLGAVEIKDGDSDTRVDVESDGTKNAMFTQDTKLNTTIHADGALTTDDGILVMARRLSDSSARPITVDDAGSLYIKSFTTYNEDQEDASATGTAIMWRDSSSLFQPVATEHPMPVDLQSSVVDSGNSTTTPLGIGGVFTGTAFDCTGYSTITNTIYADEASAASGMEFQFCSDDSFGANTDSHKFNLEADSQRRFQFPVTARYFRIKFTNGGAAQGAFDVQNIAHRTNTLTSIHRLGDTTTTDRSAQLVKAAIMGETTGGGGGMVNVKVNPSGTLETNAEITEPLPAGTNNIGDVDVLTLPNVTIGTNTDSIDGAGAPTVDSYTTDDVNLAANTANQVVVTAPGASKQIWVYGLVGTADVAGTISIQDEDDTALSGIMPVAETGGFVMNPSGNYAMPWIKVATNKALEVDTVTCAFDGVITYAIVSV